MVTAYYGLKEQPFGVTPDSRYLYSSATHREALASLLYALESGRGFAALIAKPGMGKTTLLFHALNQLQQKTKTVFLYQTIHKPVDFLQAVLADLGIHDTQSSLIELQSKLNEVVTQQSRSGKPLIVVIDEAQTLDDSVLEMVRMISNFETSRDKLIQIVLAGQPQLADKLASPDFVQLRQRVSIVSCLKQFSPEETALYIGHRLRIAGYSGEPPLFSKDALGLIAEASTGIPRNINNLCFNALSLGCALKRTTIDCDIVREVIADLDLEPLREKKPRRLRPKQAALQKAPISVSLVRHPSKLNGWLWKPVAVGAFLVVLGGVLFHSYPWLAPKSTALRNSFAPALAAIGVSPLSRERTRQIADASLVHVNAGDTIYLICVQNFGSCNPELIHQIQTLNPWLSDLNHIEPGQVLRIPNSKRNAGNMQAILTPTGNNASTKRATQ